MKRITLPAWGRLHFEPPPKPRTLERWARFGNIFPAPVKVGRCWWVTEDAQYTDPEAEAIKADAIEFMSGETLKHTRKSVSTLPVSELQKLPVAGFYDAGVYFLWLGDQLQYVGQSGSIQRRAHCHRISGKIPHDRYTCLTLNGGLLDVERAYIKAYSPPFNSRHCAPVT